VNDVLVEVETAKAAVELPSPFAGTVAALLVEPGGPVPVGTPIITIETAGDAPAAVAAAVSGAPRLTGEAGPDGRIATLVGYGPRPGAAQRRPRRTSAPTSAPAAEPHGPPGPPGPPEPPPALVPLAKPPVRKLARDLGVDLRTVAGTGAGGVITRDDVRGAVAAPAAPTAPAGPGTRREPIRGVRKATAEAVVASAFTAPHVTEFLTVDVTATMELRDRLRASHEYADVALSPLAFVAKAVCLALRRTPVLNARWDEPAQEIVYVDRVRLGIAAATPRGLLVPTIRDADTLALRDLAAALADLTATARAGRTPPGDLRGGTFTITNVGVFGVDSGTPILNPGEAGILAVGAVRQAPWVVDGALAVRTVCTLALSFDHRLVDGEQGSRFLADVGALLTDPGLALTW
jgi:2-oxoisovalerate dehydrogenase E2 component (dihydrolipoyl transacylase)